HRREGAVPGPSRTVARREHDAIVADGDEIAGGVSDGAEILRTIDKIIDPRLAVGGPRSQTIVSHLHESAIAESNITRANAKKTNRRLVGPMLSIGGGQHCGHRPSRWEIAANGDIGAIAIGNSFQIGGGYLRQFRPGNSVRRSHY